MNLRKIAKGKPCMVRIPGICDGGGESGTTVLAHYRLPGYCGVSMKPIDHIGAWCCGPCHDMVDGRTKPVINGALVSDHYLKVCHAEGVMRTIAELERMGES